MKRICKTQTHSKASERGNNDNNDDGFVTLWFLFSLPIVFSLGLFALTTFFQIERESNAQRLCYEIFFPAQKQAAEWIDKLLGLNSESRLLKARYEKAQLRAAAAAARGDPAALAAAEAEVIYYHGKRVALSIKQQMIIEQAQLSLIRAELQAQVRLQSYFKNSDFKIGEFLISKTQITMGPSAHPGVRRESVTLAPTYALVPDIDSQQKLKITWANQRIASPLLARFLKTKFNEEKSCAISPYWKNAAWQFSVDQDKFW